MGCRLLKNNYMLMIAVIIFILSIFVNELMKKTKYTTEKFFPGILKKRKTWDVQHASYDLDSSKYNNYYYTRNFTEEQTRPGYGTIGGSGYSFNGQSAQQTIKNDRKVRIEKHDDGTSSVIDDVKGKIYFDDGVDLFARRCAQKCDDWSGCDGFVLDTAIHEDKDNNNKKYHSQCWIKKGIPKFKDYNDRHNSGRYIDKEKKAQRDTYLYKNIPSTKQFMRNLRNNT